RPLEGWRAPTSSRTRLPAPPPDTMVSAGGCHDGCATMARAASRHMTKETTTHELSSGRRGPLVRDTGDGHGPRQGFLWRRAGERTEGRDLRAEPDRDLRLQGQRPRVGPSLSGQA